MRSTPGPDPAEPALSVVVPLYNEEPIIPELVARIRAALAGLPPAEIVAVDDGSRDRTPELLREAAAAPGTPVRVVRNDPNRGQFQATCRGLLAARGAVVVAMDGDLQDPPELLGALYAAWDPARLDAVVAVKAAREYGPLLRLGSHLYTFVLRRLDPGALPRGAGSYCLMRRDLAHAVATETARHANLSAVLALHRPRVAAVPYTKAARPAGDSKIGLLGLAREALGSALLLLKRRRPP